jgi:hypothetical protein
MAERPTEKTPGKYGCCLRRRSFDRRNADVIANTIAARTRARDQRVRVNFRGKTRRAMLRERAAQERGK